MKRLTLCVAAGNDQKRLGNCIESVKSLVDEIIIADRGLNASAREACAAMGAVLIDCRGRANLADALNHAIRQAAGDWILWLQPNEYLKASARSRFRDLLYEPSSDLLFLHVVEYTRTNEGRLRMMDFARPRLFRNSIGFEFTGNEDVAALKFADAYSTSKMMGCIGMQPFRIHAEHSAEEMDGGMAAAIRHVKFTEDELMSRDSKSPWSYYELACEYYRLRDYKQVVKALNKVIQLFLNEKTIPPAIVYKLKYAVVLDQVYFPDTERGLELAIKLYPDFTDLHYYKGLAQYHINQYAESVQAFDCCLEYGEQSDIYFVRQGTGSYLAHYYRGVCLEKLECPDEAAAAYMRSISCFQAYIPAIEALNRLVDANRIDLAACIKQDIVFPLERLQSILSASRNKERNIPEQSVPSQGNSIRRTEGIP